MSCLECGMTCDPNEYHPYAACLMFKGCGDAEKVRANLRAVRLCGFKAGYKQAEIDAEVKAQSENKG